MAKLLLVDDPGTGPIRPLGHTLQIFQPGDLDAHEEMYVAICEVGGPTCFQEEYDTLDDAVEYATDHWK